MKTFIWILALGGLAFSNLSAQPTNGLVAYYPMDDGAATVALGTANNNGIIVGNPIPVCGAVGNGLYLDGVDDEIVIINGPVTNEFENTDFSVSMYIKPVVRGAETYAVLVKRDTCVSVSSFAVRYTPLTNTLSVQMAETPSKAIDISAKLETDKCWHHFTVVRRGTRIRFFVNGSLVQEQSTNARINLSNSAPLIIGGSKCVGTLDRRYQGSIDDFRVYERALSDAEVEELYKQPDRVITNDTIVVVGSPVPVNVSTSCDNYIFGWDPSTDVSDPSIPDPVITPAEPGSTTYKVRIYDGTCAAFDTIRVTAIDPNSLDCKTVFLPKAFTPNGDGRNDTYGISNPLAIAELLSFEIFDRWGSRLFEAQNVFDRWDGSFQGQRLNPGVFLYKVRYRCEGEEQVVTGGVTLLR